MSADHENEDPKLYDLAQKVGELLVSKKCTLTVAESFTGGWLSKVLTSVPGASNWFDCAFVTYSNHSKQRLLGVTQSAIRTNTAISRQVCSEMAKGALRRSNAQFAIALTGVAGPKPIPPHPPGICWLTWASSMGKSESLRLELHGDRNPIRYKAVKHALQGILDRNQWLR